MKIEYEGAVYDFDFDDITVRQAIKIEKHTGMTLAEWGKALSPEEEGKGADLIAMQALGWLVLHGGDIPVGDCDFKIVKLAEAFAKAAAEEEAATADEPDPTTPAGVNTPATPGSTPPPTAPPASPSPPPASPTGSGQTG